MKKTLTILLTILLIAVLTACASEPESSVPDMQEMIENSLTEAEEESERTEEVEEVILIVTGRYGQGTPEINDYLNCKSNERIIQF
ncbi:MAG: hypothetical protein FWG92_07810 [Leptospirales bacterium]|nr:hypothetical protein [Leptospirales bacterium]